MITVKVCTIKIYKMNGRACWIFILCCFSFIPPEATCNKHKKQKEIDDDGFAPVFIEYLTIKDLTDSYEISEDNYYSNIKGLSIENCNFSRVPIRLLNEFVSLKELTLRNNIIKNFKIERLNSAHETMSKNIEGLHIENQELGVLTNNSFMKYRNLISLSLICTALDVIEENAFRGLDKLDQLNLTGNNLKDLTGNILVPLKSLQILTLKYNQFQDLRKTFGNTTLLTKLKILHMEHNPIKKINYFELKKIFPNLKRYKHCIRDKKPCENVENICGRG